MKKVLIITNIPAPYRVDLFYFLEQTVKDYAIMVMYTSNNEDNRSWIIDENKLRNSIFLNSKVIKIKKKFDNKYIHIPGNIIKELKKLSPDIVIAMEYNPAALITLYWCKRNKVPFIHWTDGTLNSEKNINFLQKWSRKYIINNSFAFIASSTKAKEKLLKYGALESEIFVSFLTADISKYFVQTKEGKGNKILYVGSLIERKGVDLLINVLANLDNEFHLSIVGDGPDKEFLYKFAENKGILNKISFEGYLEGELLRQKYAESDIFVLPTREDCFGLVILEAMCASLPIVCSKYADGAYDLLINGFNGYIIDPYNIDEFSSKINELLGDNNHCRHLGQNSLDMVKNFSFEEVSKGILKAIQRVDK